MFSAAVAIEILKKASPMEEIDRGEISPPKILKPSTHRDMLLGFSGKSLTMAVFICRHCEFGYPLFTGNSGDLLKADAVHCPNCGTTGAQHYMWPLFIERVEIDGTEEPEAKAKKGKAVVK